MDGQHAVDSPLADRPHPLVDELGEALIATDRHGIVRVWNTAAEQLFGHRREHAVGRGVGELIFPESAQALASETESVVFAGGRWSGEMTLHDAAGVQFTAYATCAPVRDSNGQVCGIVSLTRDLSAEVRARTALRASEDLFRRVFEESPLGKLAIGPDLRIRRVNPSLCRMLGYPAEDVVGHRPAEFTHPDDVDADEAAMRAVLQGTAPSYTRDKRFLARSGRVVDGRVTGSGVRGDDGAVRYLISVVEDVTEVKAARRALEDQSQLLTLAMGSAGVTAWDANLVTGHMSWSADFEADYGMDPPGDVAAARSALRPDDRHVVDETCGDADVALDAVVGFVDGWGQPRWVNAQGSRVLDGKGRAVAMRGVLTDVTPRYAAEEREHAAELSYRTVVETAVDAFVGMDADGRVNEWNPAAERLLGFDRQDVIGQPLRDLIIPPAYRAAHDAAVARRGTDVPTGPLLRRELEALRSDGSLVPIELQVSAVRSGDTLSFAAFLRDLTQRKEYERRLARRAVTDPLTGLPNRELLLTRLTEALATTAATPTADAESGTAVLFVDVDRFKVVNDSLGHAVGDRLLVTLAERLRTAVRPDETLGRFGGDEFVLLSPDVSDRAEAVAVARRLRGALAEPLDVDGRLLAVDLSVGIAISAPGEVAPEALLRDADAAMYAAKAQTGDSVVVFDDTLRGHVVERLALERELRDALDAGALDVHYQPVLTLDGELVGFEALARWKSPLRGMVPPTTFVPLAEETGLIGRLGAYVLDEACAQLAAWQHAIPGLQNATMAVNLSGRQLADAQLVETVSEVLGRHGLAPDLLCLEITENVLADEGEAGSLERLRELGVRLAIDDFGTGYSSLVSLRRLPVDVLKLDRLFVDGLGSNVSDTAIVRCGIDLAHALGMTVVAEGVETAQQLTVLRTLGCDNAQGYWWSRPMPAEQVGAWLRSDRPVPAAGH